MTEGQTVTDIAEITAPWNKQVTVQAIDHDGGMGFLRLRIKEGKRFTDLELDPDTARRLTDIIQDWVESR